MPSTCRFRRYRRVWSSAAFVALSASALAQGGANFAGSYEGVLEQVHVQLHLVSGPADTLACTVDIPEGHMMGMKCSELHVNNQTINYKVPTMQGTFTGILNDGGKTLTGVWSEGTTATPLILTRVSALPAPSTSPIAPSVPIPETTSVSGPCPRLSQASYWDGNAWRPLIMPQAIRNGSKINWRAYKNPLAGAAGVGVYAQLVRFKGPEASLVLAPQPRFCVPTSINNAPTVLIGVLDVKSGYREMDVRDSDMRNPEGWISEKRRKEVETKPLSEGFVEVTPKKPLPSGQYLLSTRFGNFDFGVP